MKAKNSFFDTIPTTIFAEMSALAQEQKAINLGQGFPDKDGPDWIKEEASKALLRDPNQYPPMFGTPALRQALADTNKRFYNLDINPQTQTLITSGATEALLDSCLALIEQGDEVIIFEPFYDSYPAQVRTAGGKPVYVRLSAPDWALDEKEFRSAFSKKTKAIILNSPHNPAGKVFSKKELEIIASLLEEFDAYAICDEVYEHLIFDDKKHIPLMSLPNMHERCIRIGSAGKTFSLTGWKIGYITAAEHLIKTIAAAHQFTTFTTPPALQNAIAKALGADDAYYVSLTKEMDKGRKILQKGLKECGFDVLPCEGTYFLTADFSPFAFKGDDKEFCIWLTKEIGVTAIPMSPFYSETNGEKPKSLVRFCFAKQESVLNAAIEKLKLIKENL